MPREHSRGVCHSPLRDSERAVLSNARTQSIQFADTAKITGRFPRINEICAHAQTVNTVFLPRNSLGTKRMQQCSSNTNFIVIAPILLRAVICSGIHCNLGGISEERHYIWTYQKAKYVQISM